MGFDTERFVNFDPDTCHDLICPICTNVLEDPTCTECEHMFCTQCIHLWMGSQASCRCPVCNATIRSSQFKAIPRIAKNMLSNLTIRCENEGCTTTCKLEYYPDHQRRCAFDNGSRGYPVAPSAPPPTSVTSINEDGSIINVETPWIDPPHQYVHLPNQSQPTPPPYECEPSNSGQENERRRRLRLQLSCLICLHFCREFVKGVLLSIYYFIVFLIFFAIATVGYKYDEDCKDFPRLPLALMLIGVCSSLALFLYLCKTYIERFKDNHCRIITLFKYIAIMALIYVIIIVYGWWMQSDTFFIDFNTVRFDCNLYLVGFSFWFIVFLIGTLLLVWSFTIVKSFCVFLFE